MVKAAHKIILGDYLVIAKPWSYFFRSLLVQHCSGRNTVTSPTLTLYYKTGLISMTSDRPQLRLRREAVSDATIIEIGVLIDGHIYSVITRESRQVRRRNHQHQLGSW